MQAGRSVAAWMVTVFHQILLQTTSIVLNVPLVKPAMEKPMIGKIEHVKIVHQGGTLTRKASQIASSASKANSVISWVPPQMALALTAPEVSILLETAKESALIAP